MSTRIIPVEPFDYVVFGGTGDLAYRKLLPALYHRFSAGQIPAGCRIIAASITGITTDDYRAQVAASIEQYVAHGDQTAAKTEAFCAMCAHVQVDAFSEDGWAELSAVLAGRNVIRAFYLAVAPQLVAPICARIGASGLATPASRVVIEKPLGHDLASAHATNEAVGAVFDESRVFRLSLIHI